MNSQMLAKYVLKKDDKNVFMFKGVLGSAATFLLSLLVMVISGRSHIHSYEWTSIYGVIFTTNLWLVLISMATVLCPSVAALVKKDGQNWLRISSLPILYTGTYVSSTIHNRHILLIWELLNPSFLTSEKDKFIPQGILQMTLPCLKLWRLWVKYKCLV